MAGDWRRNPLGLLRQYWLATLMVAVGAVAVLAISLSGGSSGSVMWAGGIIGVLVGVAISAASGGTKKS